MEDATDTAAPQGADALRSRGESHRSAVERVWRRVELRSRSHLLVVAESCAIPFMLDYLRPRLADSRVNTEELLQVGSDRARSQRRHRAIRDDIGRTIPSRLVGPSTAITRAVLARHPAAVALWVLHVDAVSNALGHLVPHMRVDERVARDLWAAASGHEHDEMRDDYRDLIGIFSDELHRQAVADVDAFTTVLRTQHDITSSEEQRARRLAAHDRALGHIFIDRGTAAITERLVTLSSQRKAS